MYVETRTPAYVFIMEFVNGSLKLKIKMTLGITMANFSNFCWQVVAGSRALVTLATSLTTEPYTVREARIHVRHVRDLLKSLDPSDAFNGVDCNSLSFLSVFTDGDLGGAESIGSGVGQRSQEQVGKGAEG